MARVVNTGSIVVGAASSSTTASFLAQGNSYSGYEVTDTPELCIQYGLSSVTENTDIEGFADGPSGSWSQGTGSTLNADTSYLIRARDDNYGINGTTKSKKLGAVAATASTPTSSLITASTATIACNYFPNVNASTCSAQLQYKRSVDSTWTNAGTANATGDYNQVAESENITGLTASTNYDVRLVITRTTNTDTSLTSATHTFSTLAGNPTVTTNAATGIDSTVATLNATVDVGSYASNCDVKWVYKITSPPEGGTTVACDSSPLAASGGYNKGITGLTASTAYYARATVYWPTGTTTNSAAGDIVSFTTSASPAAVAAEEDHMLVFEYDRKYGVACDDSAQAKLVFTVPDISSSSSNRFLNAAVPWVAGDVTVSVDTGSGADSTPNNIAVLPTRLGTTHLYLCPLSASEMQGNDIYISLVDANGPAWRDVLLHVRTHLTLGTVDIDAATGQKANTTAFKATGYGSGHGMSAVGGATGQDINGVLGEHVLRSNTLQSGSGTSCVLDTGASGTNDYYNGAVILFYSGTGAGQCRAITDYVGGTFTCTLNKTLAAALGADTKYLILPGDDPWKVSPGVELSALPTATSNFADMVQFVFQRFAYKRTQTATEFKMMKAADDTTVLATGGVDDDNTTQSHNRLT